MARKREKPGLFLEEAGKGALLGVSQRVCYWLCRLMQLYEKQQLNILACSPPKDAEAAVELPAIRGSGVSEMLCILSKLGGASEMRGMCKSTCAFCVAFKHLGNDNSRIVSAGGGFVLSGV